MDTNSMDRPGATWQRMAIWLAGAGYTKLELSTVMTLREMDRKRPAPGIMSVIPGPGRDRMSQFEERPLLLELHAAAD
jgi:hypothetical protein